MKISKEKKYRVLRFITKYSFVFIFVISIMLPFVSVKAVCGDPGELPCNPTNNTLGNTDVGISNPIPTINNLPELIKQIINIVLVVGVPILVLAIIYAGFLYVKAQGNSSELEVAHRTLLYTVIGGALLLGAFVIAEAIRATITDIGAGV
jgi:hypothetical protein